MSDFKCPHCRGPLQSSNRHHYFYRCESCKKDYPRYKLEEYAHEEGNRSVLEKVKDFFVKEPS